eukprot:gene26175-biopygen14621
MLSHNCSPPIPVDSGSPPRDISSSETGHCYGGIDEWWHEFITNWTLLCVLNIIIFRPEFSRLPTLSFSENFAGTCDRMPQL